MTEKGSPFYRKNREYESNLHKYRIRQNLTIKQLVKRVGVGQSIISALANGSLSPLYEVKEKAGQLRPYAAKICEVLHATTEDIFPRYFCNIKIPATELINCQILDYSVSRYSSDSAMNLEDYHISLWQKEALNAFFDYYGSTRVREIIISRVLDGCTLEEVGNRLNVSRERVRQIERKWLLRFRVFLQKRGIKNEEKEEI